MKNSRRDFLKVVGGGAASSLASQYLLAGPDKPALSAPASSGIEHIIVLTMENRSFDHFLGWAPGADGQQAGLSYPDRNGVLHPTYHLTDYQGCGHPIPDNTYSGAHTEYDGGKCDGWLLAGNNDDYVLGYYVQNDLPFLGQAINHWTQCDRYFSATMSETFPNRMYQHAAQTDRLDNSLTQSLLPTIWDTLALQNVSSRYYFSDIPFLALWGPKYLAIGHLIGDFFQDCAAGTLPNVAYVDPHFLGETEGLANSDHPHSDIRNGEAFMNQVYTAVTKSPQWESTVLVITFDEWGGFFDHVQPQTAPDVNAAAALRGFRVPCLLVSPWSQNRNVAHTVYDHTSILKMIEWRWGLPPLTVRDQAANNIADGLDFGKAKKHGPQFDVPAGPFGQVCLATAASPLVPTEEWLGLAKAAQAAGWPLGF